MNFTEEQLLAAARRVGIADDQVRALWSDLATTNPARSKFEVAHVGYFFGALLVIGAMGWFMTTAWDAFSGLAVTGLALCYALLFVITGQSLWKSEGTRVIGGLLVTVAVCMMPLATFGFERAIGWWPANDPGSFTNFHPFINASWIVMEITTIAAGIFAIRKFPFPFLTAPIAYALWYMSMDVTAFLFRSYWTWHDECIISAAFGAVMLLVAFYFDGKFELDFSFWGYLFGMLTFWCGLSAMNSDSELSKFIYFLLNVAFLVVGPILNRRVFVIFGTLGAFGYLGHLSYTVFKDSALFPFALSLLGVALIFGAMKYKAYEARVNAWAAATFQRKVSLRP